MNKVGIITCSTSGLDYIAGYDDVYIARTSIVLDGIEYFDGLDINPDEFYQKLAVTDSVPTTAQPSIGQLTEIYDQMKQAGYTEAIYISISEHLSGTFQTVCLSQSYVKDFTVYPFDSKSASFVSGFMAMEAKRLADAGKSAPEILHHLNDLRDNDRIFFMVDDLKYMVKNGRLSNASAFLANMLQIKPLLELDADGKIKATEKIRTTKKAIHRVVQSFLDDTDNGKNQRFTFLFNTNAPDKVAIVKSQLEAVGFDTSHMLDASITPAIGCHIGSGVIGIGYIK